jgi:alkylation response protein AidB-like acyl-CoA dehydrogenase
LAELYSAGERLKLLADRAISRAAQGLPPGPESSLIKIAWSQLSQQVALAAADIDGLDALVGSAGHDILQSRSSTIAGGTTEVNKNIVAERVLGLPRDPAPAR